MKHGNPVKAGLALALFRHVLVAMSVLLLSPYVAPTWRATQNWSWDEVPGATSYRLYWSVDHGDWWGCQMFESPASTCVDGRCHEQLSTDTPPPGQLVFFTVTAVNETGESGTGHGEVRLCP
jgi:hypothetical protein